MYIYFLLLHIAAFFGHKKARMLVQGQQETLRMLTKGPVPKGAVWFHAASVGEFEQARPLIERLKNEQPQRKVIVTFFSPSGYEMRKNYALADMICYLPFATRRNVRKWLDAVQPSMAVFVKYEFWYPYLRALKKRNTPAYSVCAIFRPAQRFFHWYGFGAERVLKCFTHIYVQDEASALLLKKRGIVSCSVAGDTRFDRMMQVKTQTEQLPSDTPELAAIAQFVQGSERVIVAGSTWHDDEALLASFIANAPEETKLILVPHELNPEHLHYIFNLFKGRFVRYSSFKNSPDLLPQDMSVMVVDTMGLLSKIYRFGQTAYIGGGFGAGIHNTIEAAAYGIPVLFGPKYQHFREAKGLINAGAARSIRNQKELNDALIYMLANHTTLGEKATEYISSEIGATDKIYKGLFL